MTAGPGAQDLEPRFGPDAGLPAGYARLPAGATLVRGHSPGRAAGFFGPAIGRPGANRFDVTGPRRAGEPGVCYLAFGMEGVLLERVLRGARLPVLSAARLGRDHAWSAATLAAPLTLVDLWVAPAAHGLELADISQPPRLVAAAAGAEPSPPYPATQALADAWAARNAAAGFPVPGGRVDGVLYGSRFGPASLCVAVWEHAAPALVWGTARPLGGAPGLAEAANRLGVGLVA